MDKSTWDKSTWGPGPWQSEPDRKEWRHVGLPCLIVRSTTTGALCGYVGVAPGHAAYGLDYAEAEAIDAHGGLTYSAPCREPICHEPAEGEPATVWWLGFDCAHAGDLAPTLPFRLGEYRDLGYVESCVNRLAEQLAGAAA